MLRRRRRGRALLRRRLKRMMLALKVVLDLALVLAQLGLLGLEPLGVERQLRLLSLQLLREVGHPTDPGLRIPQVLVHLAELLLGAHDHLLEDLLGGLLLPVQAVDHGGGLPPHVPDHVADLRPQLVGVGPERPLDLHDLGAELGDGADEHVHVGAGRLGQHRELACGPVAHGVVEGHQRERRREDPAGDLDRAGGRRTRVAGRACLPHCRHPPSAVAAT